DLEDIVHDFLLSLFRVSIADDQRAAHDPADAARARVLLRPRLRGFLRPCQSEATRRYPHVPAARADWRAAVSAGSDAPAAVERRAGGAKHLARLLLLAAPGPD